MTTEYEYWIETDIDGEPYLLLRTTPYVVGDFADVWFRGDWNPTRTTTAEMSGLGGAANYRRIPKSEVGRLLPGFLKTLRRDEGTIYVPETD